MRRYVIGGLVGFAAWLGTGALAHAQSGVDGYEPSKVYVSDSNSLYKATVTSNNSFWFHLYVKLDGEEKTYSRNLVITSGPTYTFSKVVSGMENWGMQVGDELDYYGIAQGPTGMPSDHHYVTVESDPITLESHPRSRILEEESYADRFRGVMA